MTYTITARNEGPDAAASVTLSDPLPAYTTFVSLTAPAGWSCTTPAVGASGIVRCTIPTFAVSSTTFTLVLHVGSMAAASDTIRNTVSIDSTVATDLIGTNNSAGSDTALVRTVCAPRPRVLTEMVRNGDGRLRATVSASTTQGVSNALLALTWTRLDNATVEVVGVGNVAQGQRTSLPAGTQSVTLLVGQIDLSGGAIVSLPNAPAQVTLLVRRLDRRLPVAVPLTVVDSCGEWRTFVGGGSGAF